MLRQVLPVNRRNLSGVKPKAEARIFAVSKDRPVGEGELLLGRIEDVDEQNLRAAVAQVSEALEDRPRVVEQVGEDNDEASRVEAARDSMEAIGQVSFPLRFRPIEDGEDSP